MKHREVLARDHTPDGQVIELAREQGHYIIRVGGNSLMGSATYGSEQAMGRIAYDCMAQRRAPRILLGGLGLGYTARAVLDAFGADAQLTIAELLPAVVRFSREFVGHLAGQPLDDPRTRLFEGDVRNAIEAGPWDAILLDVDNGPSALTTSGNAALYTLASLRRIRSALEPHGVFVLWSAAREPHFDQQLRRAGLTCKVHTVRARGEIRKGPRHTLFEAHVAPAPRPARRR